MVVFADVVVLGVVSATLCCVNVISMIKSIKYRYLLWSLDNTKRNKYKVPVGYIFK